MRISEITKRIREGSLDRNKRFAEKQKRSRATLGKLQDQMNRSIRTGKFMMDKNADTQSERIVSYDTVKEEEEEESDEDNWLDDCATEKEVVVDHELIQSAEYLGTEWTERINAIQDLKPGKVSSSLATDLRPHQDIGAEKMNFIAEMDPNVVIVGDEMGLGKTLQAIEACCRATEQGRVRGSFDLVIAPKLCLSQWLGEINSKYAGVHKPKAMILNNPSTSANELLSGEYDFVITTYQFVLSRYQAFNRTMKFSNVVKAIGLDRALAQLSSRHTTDPTMKKTNALYSFIYQELRLPIRTIILDEGHMAKNEDGQIHKAIRALYAQRMFILSGTFVPNRWWDLRGLFDLFPGKHPFDTRERFNRSFAKLSGTGEYVEPSPSKRNRLVKYMMGLVLARPSSVIELPKLTVVYHDFIVDEDDALVSAGWAVRFVKLMKYIGKGKMAEKRRIRALAAAMRAQQYISGSFLVSEKARSAEEHLKEQGMRQLGEFLKSICGDNEHELKNIIDLTTDMTMQFVQHMESFVPTKKPKASDTTSTGEQDVRHDEEDSEDPEDDEVADPTYVPDIIPQVGSGKDDAEEQSDNNDDDEEKPEESDDDDDDDDDDDLNTADEAKSGQAKPDRKTWLAKLKAASLNEIFTPKVSTIMDLIEQIRQFYPDEKIVVFSISLMVHDIIEEVVAREYNHINVLRLDGRCKSIEEAQNIRDQFEAASPKTILLVTSGSAAYGVNLQMASKVIQVEPWWNLNEERQAYSRCYRSGQTRKCHVWLIRGVNSAIDFMIQNTRDKKADVNMQIVGPLRRKDCDAPQIPVQYVGGAGERKRKTR